MFILFSTPLDLTNGFKDFIVIPTVFYVVVAAAQLNLGELRKKDWLFDMGDSTEETWTRFYSYLGKLRHDHVSPKTIGSSPFPS